MYAYPGVPLRAYNGNLWQRNVRRIVRIDLASIHIDVLHRREQVLQRVDNRNESRKERGRR